MKITRILAFALVAVLGASAAYAGDIYLQAAGAATKTSNGCTKTTVQATAAPLTVMRCSNSGTQEMYWTIGVPSDSDDSWTPKIKWHANSTDSTKNACWTVSVTAIGSDSSGLFDVETTFDLDSTPGTVSDAIVGSAVNATNTAVFSSYTPARWITSGIEDCSATNCRNERAIVKVTRDNTGGCTNNFAGNVDFDMLHFNY